MPIIVNDFEIVVEPQPTVSGPQPGTTQQEGVAATPTLRPEDIERVVNHFKNRRERVQAD
ncbi:MAG TPA: hypothetical protein VIY29_30750 [Ktedonobacteraceae bacterium]